MRSLIVAAVVGVATAQGGDAIFGAMGDWERGSA